MKKAYRKMKKESHEMKKESHEMKKESHEMKKGKNRREKKATSLLAYARDRLWISSTLLAIPIICRTTSLL